LELPDIKPIPLTIHPGDVYEIPYNAEGFLDTSVRMVWDLRIGAKVIICVQEASNYGSVGTVGKKESRTLQYLSRRSEKKFKRICNCPKIIRCMVG